MFRKLEFGMFPQVDDAEVRVAQPESSHRHSGSGKEGHSGHEHHKVKKQFVLPSAFFKPGHGGKGAGGSQGPKTFELKNYRFLIPRDYSKHKEKETQW